MRIAGANIPDNKRLEVALTYIFGIGQTRARNVLDIAKYKASLYLDDVLRKTW